MAELPRALRVSQIDAEELDDGLVGMLASKLESALSLFSPSTSSSFSPEIHLSLKFLIYRLGVMANASARASPGMMLQNVRYVDGKSRAAVSPRQIYLLPILSLLPPYLLSRLHSSLLSRSFSECPRDSWRYRLWRIVESAQWVGKVWEVGGLVGFLVDGRYPSLLIRILHILQVPTADSGNVTRTISYEFMNRQLVWTGVTEFLLCVLPLVRTYHHILTRPIRRRISRLRSLLRLVSSRNLGRREYGSLGMDRRVREKAFEKDGSGLELHPTGREMGNQRKPPRKRRGPLWRLPKETCAICHQRLHKGIDKTLGLPTIDLSEVEDDFDDDGTKDTEDVLGRKSTTGDTENDDETRVHIPTRAGCDQACVYCYHCIADALVTQARLVEKQEELGKYQDIDEEDRVGGWRCLRCAEEVWSCERITR